MRSWLLNWGGLLLITVSPVAVAAQHITLKTVPIPAGEQFLLFPSRNLGMASVHIALDDPLAEPFNNPARGLIMQELRVFALPTFYGETNDAVAGRSLPMAAMIPGKRVFGTAVFALQQVDNPMARNGWWVPPGTVTGSLIQDNSSTNLYLFGSAGVRLGERTAVGASVYHADLEAVDVVSMLYARSFAIEQSGSMTEARIGLTHELGDDRRIDAVIANNRLDMSHDVWYVDWFWSQPAQTPVTRVWSEFNEDRTDTWGAHVRYTQPLGDNGARFGAILTGNTKSHPKIPNYNLVNIPRDPGNSAAFNLGVGVSNADGPARFAVELTYEPGRSHTWAYADTAITTPGGVIPKGGKTIDNQFRFNNWNMAFGLERENRRHGFQVGLRLRQIRYRLEQENFLTDTRRRTREDWMEWSPSWSYVVKFPEFEARYTGRFTARGWPESPDGFFVARAEADAPGGTDFIIGPTEAVTMPDFRVTTHRLMISIPFRM